MADDGARQGKRLAEALRRVDADPRLQRLARALCRRWRFSAKGAPKDLRVYATAVG